MPQSHEAVTYVLVPGASLGAWSWHPVSRILRERGHQVVALTLPGLSYDSPRAAVGMGDAVDYLVDAVETRNLSDVVLVSHSWGGYPATAAAARVSDRISRVVYYSAVVPHRGRAMADENEQLGQVVRSAMGSRPDGTVPLPLEAIQHLMMQDASPQLQQLVFDLCVPQPGAYMIEAVDVPPVTALGLPATYLLGAEDRALVRPGAEFAARLGVEPIEVPGSHLGMLTRPAEVAAALLALP